MLYVMPHKKLEWFFGPGQTLFLRSNMNFERHEAFDVQHLPDPEHVAAMRLWREECPWEAPPGGLTVQPTGKRYSNAPDPDDDRWLDYAETDEIIQKVKRRAPESVVVLEAFYGDQGAVFGRTVHGRIFALLPLTEAGRELLRRSRRRGKGADLGLSAARQIEDELVLQDVQPQPVRATLIARARMQALSAYEAACSLYMQEGEP